MDFLSVCETAKKWQISERSVRNYCAQGRIIGAVLNGNSWLIPASSTKPQRKQKISKAPTNLLARLKLEQEAHIRGGIYHRLQIDLTYNSNHMEGSRLTHDQTRFIFETNTIGVKNESINVDDIIETTNHFRCIDLAIRQANYMLSESFIKQIHLILKTGTSDANKAWFAVGDYKKLENEVGGADTTPPKEVAAKMKDLCARAKVPFQTFANRSDLVGGSTLGNLSNTQVSVHAVDIGLPQLAMHSSYETAGVSDTLDLIRLMEEFFCSHLEENGAGALSIQRKG